MTKLTPKLLKEILPSAGEMQRWLDTPSDEFFMQRFMVKVGKPKYFCLLLATTSNAYELLLMMFAPGTLKTSLHIVEAEKFHAKRSTFLLNNKQAQRLTVLPHKGSAKSRKQMHKSIVAMARSYVDWRQDKDSIVSHDPMLFFETYSLVSGRKDDQLKEIFVKAYEKANEAYHSGELDSFLTDAQFDSLKEMLLNKKWITQEKADKPGAAVKHGDKVKLEQAMGSLDKVKTEEELSQWLDKIKTDVAVMTPKLDGISLQLVYKNFKLVSVYTRGDGTEGRDITPIAKYMSLVRDINKSKSKQLTLGNLTLRAEAIMPVEKFEAKYKRSPSNPKGFKNPRNMVAGLLNRKNPDPQMLADIDVVIFDVDGGGSKYGKLYVLQRMGFKNIVPHSMWERRRKEPPKAELLLKKWRRELGYQMDGLVVEVNDLQEASKLGNERNSLNPAYARAFKPDDGNRVETKVKGVNWKVSKDGYIKPTVLVEPVELSGVTVSKTTGFNAGYINQNKIGKGAVIEITRSGDVIPYITKVVKQAKQPDLPDFNKFGYWMFNETGVDIVLVNENASSEVQIRKLVHFFKACDVEFFTEGWIKRFWDAGYTTISQILAAPSSEIAAKVPGLGQVMANKIRFSFRVFQNIELPKLMYASGCFGRNLGETKLRAIYKEFKENTIDGWNGQTVGDIASQIAQLHGFSMDAGRQFAQGIKPFKEFLAENKGLIRYKKYEAGNSSAPLNGQVVVFTGFRDKALERRITEMGGEVGNSVTSKTTVLLIKDANFTSEKVVKARNNGVAVMTSDQFSKRFSLR